MNGNRSAMIDGMSKRPDRFETVMRCTTGVGKNKGEGNGRKGLKSLLLRLSNETQEFDRSLLRSLNESKSTSRFSGTHNQFSEPLCDLVSMYFSTRGTSLSCWKTGRHRLKRGTSFDGPLRKDDVDPWRKAAQASICPWTEGSKGTRSVERLEPFSQATRHRMIRSSARTCCSSAGHVEGRRILQRSKGQP